MAYYSLKLVSSSVLQPPLPILLNAEAAIVLAPLDLVSWPRLVWSGANIDFMMGQWVPSQGIKTQLRRDSFEGRRNFSASQSSKDKSPALRTEHPYRKLGRRRNVMNMRMPWAQWIPGLEACRQASPISKPPVPQQLVPEPCGEQWSSFSKTSSSLAWN